jgi:hypothetical protein
MRLWCEPGQHFWVRPRQPGRPPKACPMHYRSSATAALSDALGGSEYALTLWCEPGQHFWERPPRPGRPPKICPIHRGSHTAPAGARAAGSVRPRLSASPQTSPSTRRRGGWLGDLRRCFLLEEGWGFRFEINRFVLKGRAWPLPVTVADSLGLEAVDHRWLSPQRPDLAAQVEVTRSGGSCLVGATAEPLRRLGARDGDLAFLCFQEARYAIVLRREDELEGADAIAKLLWRCGLDPSDPVNRGDPWGRLSRVLGGSERTRDEVRRRLEARGDSALLALLDEVGIVAPARTESWPTGWQYLIPDAALGDALIVHGANGRVRRLVGVVDVSGQPGDELLVTDGGLAWIEEEADVAVREIPRARGLIPAARKRGWTRWLRAEHALRLVGLAGEEFWVNRERTGWRAGVASADSLIEGVETVPRVVAPVSEGPAEPVRTPYPRAALPFDRAARDAEERGILALGADPRSGIRAIYGDGREATGSSLLDVLA